MNWKIVILIGWAVITAIWLMFVLIKHDPLSPEDLNWQEWPPQLRIEKLIGQHFDALGQAGYNVMASSVDSSSNKEYLVVWPYKDIAMDRYLSWWVTTEHDTIRTAHMRWY